VTKKPLSSVTHALVLDTHIKRERKREEKNREKDIIIGAVCYYPARFTKTSHERVSDLPVGDPV
jgi:hypothetical protein